MEKITLKEFKKFFTANSKYVKWFDFDREMDLLQILIALSELTT